jgi:DNA modification methylase
MIESYYSDDSMTIYCGDALDVLPYIKRADCVALDPPYSMIPNAFAGKDDGAAGTSATPVRLLTETLRETRRLLPDGGSAGLICDWRRMPDVSYLATLVGLRINTCVAWTRDTPGMGSMFRSAWDPMLVLSVGTPTVLDKAAVRNVIHTPKPRGGEHPYEKPVELWRHLFDRIPPGLIVDPFMGTGAALIAARLSGHRAIGIEVDERWCEAAVQRLAQTSLGLVA